MIAFEEDRLSDILIGARNPAEPSLTPDPRHRCTRVDRQVPLPEIQLCVMDP